MTRDASMALYCIFLKQLGHANAKKNKQKKNRSNMQTQFGIGNTQGQSTWVINTLMVRDRQGSGDLRVTVNRGIQKNRELETGQTKKTRQNWVIFTMTDFQYLACVCAQSFFVTSATMEGEVGVLFVRLWTRTCEIAWWVQGAGICVDQDCRLFIWRGYLVWLWHLDCLWTYTVCWLII